MNPAKPTAAARPSLYGSAKPGEVISLSVVDAATGRERVAPRPVLGARFYGGVVVGMCIVTIGLLVWMGGNEPTPAPVVATVTPIKHADKSIQVTDSKLKEASSTVTVPIVMATPAPAPVTAPAAAVVVAEQPSVTAILGPAVSTAPPPKAVVAKKIAPAKQSVASNRVTNKTVSNKPPAVVASKPKSPEKIVIASEQTKPAVRAQKHDPDVDLIEAVISRIGRK